MKFVKTPKFVWGVAVIVYLVIGYLYISKVYGGKAKKLARLSREIREQKIVVARLTEEVKDYNKILQEKDSLLGLWEEVKKHLPSKPAQETWLQEIALMAAQSGVELTTYRPKPPVQHELYKEYPVEVKVESGFHELGVFISYISNANRLMKVKDLKIMRGGGEGSTIIANFVISNYVYSPAPAGAVQKRKKKRRLGFLRR